MCHVAVHICQDVSVTISHWVCCSEFKEHKVSAVIIILCNFLYITDFKLHLIFGANLSAFVSGVSHKCIYVFSVFITLFINIWHQ